MHTLLRKKQSPTRQTLEELGERSHVKILAGDSDLSQLLCFVVNFLGVIWANLINISRCFYRGAGLTTMTYEADCSTVRINSQIVVRHLDTAVKEAMEVPGQNCQFFALC